MIRDGEVVCRPQCRRNVGWVVPPRQFVKCNIGMKWSNVKMELGAAWILINSEGTLLLHSRRSFLRVWTKDEAYYLSLAWAIESMVSLRCQRVYFAIEGGMMLLEWSVMKEIGDMNRDARLIASSVVNGDKFQFYVARGYPSWL
uniref:RNase H type-1 domain-containing protein n=1 Tax=Brassica oleracea TaxID=3712 RepID=A0A3P6FZD7_BRAOL|nr:unnamed protein product [Brassica oleracea]